jgi:chlorobactene glucosyltransferase
VIGSLGAHPAVLVLSLFVLISWIFSLATTIANLLYLPRLRAVAPFDGPLVSVLIPARNEERTIERTVRAFLAQDYPHFEVIVVDDRSTDRTAEVLAAIGDPRFTLVHGADKPEGWLGKPWALHQASRTARGELLLFADADVIYAPGALTAAVARLQSGGAAMIALFPHFEMRGIWEHAAMPQLPISGLTVLPTFLGDRRQIPFLAIGGGPGMLMHRADYDAIGGHEALRAAVVDDVGLARRMRMSGRRTAMLLADDFVSLRMYHGLREIVDGFTKNMFAVFQRNYVTMAGAVAFLIVVNFLPYVRAAAGDPFAIAAVIAILLSRVILFRALRYPLWSALLLHPLSTAVWCWIGLRSVWLTGVRRELHWRGRKYDASSTGEVVASARRKRSSND